MKIPKKISIGGQEIEIKFFPNLEGTLGKCCLANGLIRIAETFDGLAQSPTSIENTYWHEVIHAILDTMGETELSGNEKFVCTFAGFLTECIHSMENNEKCTDNEKRAKDKGK